MKTKINKDFKNDLKTFIATLAERETKTIGDDDHYIKDLGIDSLKVVELAIFIEKKLKLVIDDLMYNKMYSINSTLETLYTLLQEETKLK